MKLTQKHCHLPAFFPATNPGMLGYAGLDIMGIQPEFKLYNTMREENRRIMLVIRSKTSDLRTESTKHLLLPDAHLVRVFSLSWCSERY